MAVVETTTTLATVHESLFGLYRPDADGSPLQPLPLAGGLRYLETTGAVSEKPALLDGGDAGGSALRLKRSASDDFVEGLAQGNDEATRPLRWSSTASSAPLLIRTSSDV